MKISISELVSDLAGKLEVCGQNHPLIQVKHLTL